ncbi:hypothetical protein M0802_006504 [Mischocyttarus mexicanus]|nr:hypothetical protein M0802_006504 [Mischocyttarus mexicanus]
MRIILYITAGIRHTTLIVEEEEEDEEDEEDDDDKMKIEEYQSRVKKMNQQGKLNNEKKREKRERDAGKLRLVDGPGRDGGWWWCVLPVSYIPLPSTTLPLYHSTTPPPPPPSPKTPSPKVFLLFLYNLPAPAYTNPLDSLHPSHSTTPPISTLHNTILTNTTTITHLKTPKICGTYLKLRLVIICYQDNEIFGGFVIYFSNDVLPENGGIPGNGMVGWLVVKSAADRNSRALL